MLRDSLVAWLFTLVLEVPIVAVFYADRWRRMAATAAVTTTVTNLAMNLLLPSLTTTVGAFLVIGESLALLLEALVYFLMVRRAGLGQAFVASAVANTASYGLGLVCSPYLFGR